MNPSTADVSATVEYSMDRWQMSQIPWALWFCVAGLAICLHVDSRGVNGSAVAFVYIALLGLAFAGWAATSLIGGSTYPWYLVVSFSMLITVLVVAIISLFGTVGGYHVIGRLWWSQLVRPPLNVFGWMLLYLGCGWIAFALLRHVYPARPIIMLSPAGISFNRSWLRDLFIPWQAIQGVGQLETENAGGAPTIFPHTIAVSVRNDFYEQHMASKRSILSPPGAEAMFRPKGSLMQMVLASPELIVDFEDFREPMEARWKAFRDQPRAVAPSGRRPGTSIVFGRWSIDGSWWQVVMFVTPILAMVAVILHASGIWPS